MANKLIQEVTDDKTSVSDEAVMTAEAIQRKIEVHSLDETMHVNAETMNELAAAANTHIDNWDIHLTTQERAALNAAMAGQDSGLDTNYWGDGTEDIVISSNTVWDSTASGNMLVNHAKNFTINSGCTLTIYARMGCVLYVSGNFINNGTIQIQSRYYCYPAATGITQLVIARTAPGGTSNQAPVFTGCGSDIITAEAKQPAMNSKGLYWVIPVTGAAAGSGTGSYKCGGGGYGGSVGSGYSGSPAYGTCFSGGAGSGGATYVSSGAATAYGGQGGAGAAGIYDQCSTYHSAGGGAGNPGGNAGGVSASAGTWRSGGLFILYTRGTITNTGYIYNLGGAGGNASYGTGGDTCNPYGAGGGGSGGGITMMFYGGSISNSGSISVAGGAGGGARNVGYAGGAGYAQYTKVYI